MEKSTIHVSLVGNPNAGKSTLFNHLTGAHQHVGNYPGVTVEKKTGICAYDGYSIEVTDLPGSYSLSAYSEDERVTRDFLLEHFHPDMAGNLREPAVVVNVVDASNLERNLYFTVQLKELGVPLILVLNMMDIAEARKAKIDLERLSQIFDAPVVVTVGYKADGLEDILRNIILLAQKKKMASDEQFVPYGDAVEADIADLAAQLPNPNWSPLFKRWVAVKILEKDQPCGLAFTPTASDPEVTIAAKRYEFITRLCDEFLEQPSAEETRRYSDRLDSWLIHRFLGLPIFLLMMYLVFQLTFTLGAYPMEWIEQCFQWLGGWISGFWPVGSDSLLKSLLVDGILGGVGGVVIFLPNILALFLAISLLEDSGYMARAAFLMDRFLNKIGLQGKSFIPMMVGFGCSVPGIMATRTLENRRERLATMFVVPLMSCGARFPIYALLIPAFFAPMWQAPVLWMMYMIGILLAVVLAKILRCTVLGGEPIPFILELPPYHVPTLRTVGISTFQRGWQYVKKAGTVILGISIILWFLTTFPQLPSDSVPTSATPSEQAEAELEYSFAGRLGHALEPVLRPMGCDWKIGTALVGAFAAKEVFVAQMGIVYKIGEAENSSDALQKAVRKDYTPLAGFCILLFSLIGTPCMATVAVMARESSWKWALAQWGTLTLLAWSLATLVFQIGRLWLC